jgi:hypothetical protein
MALTKKLVYYHNLLPFEVGSLLHDHWNGTHVTRTPLRKTMTKTVKSQNHHHRQQECP